MAVLTGFNKVKVALQKRIEKTGTKVDKMPTVLVGYTQKYAIYVHENLKARHPVGQAKFLEAPARKHAKTLAKLVVDTMAKGQPVLMGLFIAGLRLQRESQLLCPVDTGALRNSAFTRKEE